MTIYHFQTFLYAVDSAGKKHQICYDERKLDEQGFSETIRIGKHECKANSSLNEYKGELEKNFIILKNAANVCDDTMGSDDLSRRHIAKLPSRIHRR